MSGIMSMLLGAVSSAAVAVDEFFNRVTLLLPGNGTNGAQNNTFLDSSTNNFTITRNGNTTQGTFSPFSQTGWSNNFVRASSQYLTLSNSSGDFSFGTGAFTIECWVNLASLPSGTGYPASYWLFGGGPVNSDPGIDFYINNTQIGFNLTTFLSATAIGNHGMSVGVWYHVAVVRGGGSNQTVSIYVNGTRVATASSVTATADAASTGIAISAAEPSGATSGNFDGYISNYRVVKGTAVYDPTSSTLTVPTAPLTAISNTVLLTCQSNRFIDTNTQVSAKTITINGTPSVQAFSPFAPTAAYSAATVGGSGYFDGTGDYLSYSSPSTSVREWWLTDWTIEAWVYPTNLSTWGFSNESCLIGNASPTSTTNYWSFGPFTDGTVKFKYFNGSAVTVTSVATVRANQWNHIAMIRNSSGIKIFVNGVGNTFTAVSGTPQSSSGDPLVIGQINNTSIMGYVSGLRIVYGSNVYTNDFTPPTAPPTAITNTSFLLNYTNAGITDATAKNDLETVGNAQISTTQSKFGGSSMYFDGTGDYLQVGPSQLLNLGASDFTIEFWIYPTSFASATYPMYSTTARAKADVLAFEVNTSGVITAYLTAAGGGVWSIASAGNVGTLTLNTWNHVALVRNGTAFRGYVNGVQGGMTNNSSSAVASFDGFSIGAFVASGFLTGYMDDLRITRFARYTAAFTPPTTAFPLQ